MFGSRLINLIAEKIGGFFFSTLAMLARSNHTWVWSLRGLWVGFSSAYCYCVGMYFMVDTISSVRW